MWNPAVGRIDEKFKQAALAAIMIAIVPTAGAFASHFKVVHSLMPAPPTETMLFCSPCFSEIDYETTPSAEEYLFDQLFQ